MKFKNKINGPRITLKSLKPDFETSEMVFDVINESREFLLPWLPFASIERTKTKEDTFHFLEHSENAKKNDKEAIYGIFVNNKFIGMISVIGIEKDHKRGEIGFWISKYHSGNGYVGEALKTLEKELFNEMDFNRIMMRCDSDNTSSENVMKRAGYTFEGKWRKHKFQPLRGKFVDYVFYSKLKSEYEKED